jgi:hypothetical protein
LDLSILGTKLKAVIITHHGIGATYLTAFAASNALREGKKPTIVEFSPINRNLFERFISIRGFSLDEVSFEQDLKAPGTFPIIIFAVGFDLRPLVAELEKYSHVISFVTTHVGTSLGLALKARVFGLKELGNNIYVLEDRRNREKIYLEMNQFKITEVQYLGKKIDNESFRVLLDSMAEYGEISTADAIFILQGKLKLSRTEARRILYELVKDGKMKIEGGKLRLNSSLT